MKFVFSNFKDLNNAMRVCKKCKLCDTRQNVVYGEGDENADLMLIAEAPGYYEDKIGKPFVGKAGDIINEALNQNTLSREDIFISNIIKCHPPGNRNPEEDEIKVCLDYLRNQVLLLKPKVVLLLGSIASKCILGEEYFISRCRGKVINKKGIKYIPTWHPAAVLRDERKKNDFLIDFKLAVEESKK